MWVTIINSDGDVLFQVSEVRPEMNYPDSDYYTVMGLDYLQEHNDSNYWPEGYVVQFETR